MFLLKLNFMETSIVIKNMGASFSELEKCTDELILVFLVSSVTPKRSYLTMKRIKNLSESILTKKRLHNLALISIVKSISK